MSLRYHEIAESGHRILNPFTDYKLDLLGEAVRLGPGTRRLDLACGKGEMLCRCAARHGITGVGVDLSEVFLAAAGRRADELGVTGEVRFEHGDGTAFARGQAGAGYDVVSCVGATWIGGGLTGTIELMLPALAGGGVLLVGEPYWISEPPPEALAALGFGREDCGTLGETLTRFEAAGTELVEMVMADEESWDRYMSSQWWPMSGWLTVNPGDPDAAEFRETLGRARRSHLTHGRRYLGWGVFVLRP
ncbi:methyltransferase domain-containing protein [Spongiactinospora sp. TRM90649]|uniref:SAM-dependent methyltransferase n=1 Tax=Spongiactinospora sp. TRM90649 TaxID=3031114 RepID=UPI0023F8A4C8|nr:methyltransferase domain-containing protein [Spongiactinospora sp. TRM90649]MDF5755306.1 methyltransferase domain-containing protein [Spongiactinospora sp. TRM90649]